MVERKILDKVETTERCVRRAREEFADDPEGFVADFTRQDAAVMNIQRACEACIDIGNMLVRDHRLGLPKANAEVFDLLMRAGWIDRDLAAALRRMVGYRNVAVHQYVDLSVEITIAVIRGGLDDCVAFARVILVRLSGPHASA